MNNETNTPTPPPRPSEAHRKVAAEILLGSSIGCATTDDVKQGARLIAESEAKAIAAEKARAEKAEADLAFERARNTRLFAQRDEAVEAQEKAEAEVARLTAQAEKVAPVQGYASGIPWSMHLRAYDAYCKRNGCQSAMVTGGCRGGFHTSELDQFIPGWRDELSQVAKLTAERDELAKQVEKCADEAADIHGRFEEREALRNALHKYRYYVDASDAELAEDGTTRSLALLAARDADTHAATKGQP